MSKRYTMAVTLETPIEWNTATEAPQQIAASVRWHLGKGEVEVAGPILPVSSLVADALSHLRVALLQSAPEDDAIILGHVREAVANLEALGGGA